MCEFDMQVTREKLANEKIPEISVKKTKKFQKTRNKSASADVYRL